MKTKIINPNLNLMRNKHVFASLLKRHLKVLLSNKTRMFYALMVPIIILFVYILFLRNMELTAVSNGLQELGFKTEEFTGGLLKNVKTIVDAWMFSGIVSITTITISLQTNSLLVEDKESGVNKDFISSPIKKETLITSYFIYNLIITVSLTIIIQLVVMLILACYGEFYLGMADFLTMTAVILLNCIPTTLIAVFICMFIKTEPVLTSIIAIFSAAIGFLTGAYMPISMLPKAVGYLCGFVPGTYSCSLIRYSYLRTPFNNLEAFLHNNPEILPGGTKIDDVMNLVRSNFGYDIDFFGMNITPNWSVLITAIVTVVFLVLCLVFSSNVVKVESEVVKISKKIIEQSFKKEQKEKEAKSENK